MGRKVGLRINTKRFGSMTAPCTKEMVTLLTCLARCNNDNEKCVRQKQMLSTCMKAQVTWKPSSFRLMQYMCFCPCFVLLINVISNAWPLFATSYYSQLWIKKSLGEASIIICSAFLRGKSSIVWHSVDQFSVYFLII